MVALCCPQYNERPQLAKVLSLSPDKLRVQWFDGSWSRKWKVYTYRVGKKTLEWVEEVSRQHIVASNILLTRGGSLTAKSKRDLKQAYVNK